MLGTIIFTILLLIVLLFSYITISRSSSQGLEGFPVMFGMDENAGGSSEPPMTEISTEPLPAVASKSEEAPLISQNDEPSIEVKKKEEKETNKKQIVKNTTPSKVNADEQNEQESRRRQINQQMSGLFGSNSSGSRGNTQGNGVQGVATGNSRQGASSGIGGIGSYDLGGRSLGPGGLVQPRYTVNDYGTVVVNITVDPAGNVIHAEIGRGTNTPSATLREEALKAARNTKFNAIPSANNQHGTITYKFKLN